MTGFDTNQIARAFISAEEAGRTHRFVPTESPDALWQNAMEAPKRYAEAARLVIRELGRLAASRKSFSRQG